MKTILKDQHRCPVYKNNHRLIFCRWNPRRDSGQSYSTVTMATICRRVTWPADVRRHERHPRLLHLRKMEEDQPHSQDEGDDRYRRQHGLYLSKPLTESSDEDGNSCQQWRHDRNNRYSTQSQWSDGTHAAAVECPVSDSAAKSATKKQGQQQQISRKN